MVCIMNALLTYPFPTGLLPMICGSNVPVAILIVFLIVISSVLAGYSIILIALHLVPVYIVYAISILSIHSLMLTIVTFPLVD